MKTFNVAIIGCGGIHHSHVKGINAIENACITSVCDTKEDRLRKSAKVNNAKAYTNYLDMIEDDTIDVVHICTPHYLHASMAIAALKKDKYVLVEKPMAMNSKDAIKMIQVSAKMGNKLGVIFQNRYNDSTIKMREIIKSKEFGEIKGVRGSVAWHRNEQYYKDDWHGTIDKEGGGVLINQAIHTLDIVQLLTNSKPISVSARVSNDSLIGKIEVEDSAHLYIKYENGMSSVFYATNAHVVNSKVEVEVTLENVVLLLRGDQLYIDNGIDGLKLIVNKAPIAGEKGYWGDSHNIQIADFYDSITTGNDIYIDGVQGYNTVSILDAAYKSSKLGIEVMIEKY